MVILAAASGQVPFDSLVGNQADMARNSKMEITCIRRCSGVVTDKQLAVVDEVFAEGRQCGSC